MANLEYREIGCEGKRASLLGFGCMRFPLTADGKIDEPEAERMIDYAIASGVNYIDTAFPYHNGDSEPFVGKVLDKYPRSSYILATKLPMWAVKTLDDAKQMFENQLKRLNKDYVDFYLLHAMNKARWDLCLELGILDHLDKLKAEGKIRNIGFSFHDKYEVFEEMITYRKWDFCQIQFNYMDTDEQAGLRGYELAEKLNVPLVIMEPIKGGALASLPKEVYDIMDSVTPGRSASSWALRYVATYPNVKVILSGMSAFEHVLDNIDTFSDFAHLTECEMAAVEKAADTLKSRVKNGCTGCRYCMPCPNGVDIPKTFRIWNTYGMYENVQKAKNDFSGIAPENLPSCCVECGACEAACPQHLSIIDDLKKAGTELGAL